MASTRKLRLTRPLVCFDLETTGLNPEIDRIVEISCVKLWPGGKREINTRRLNPGIPIAAEAVRIHGISDADVAQEPSFTDVAQHLFDFLNDCDLTGFNLTSFDLPMLTHEFSRAQLVFPSPETRVIDSHRIFMAKEPRTLVAAYELYCGEYLQHAHSAEADAIAAADILEAQIGRYQDLPQDPASLDLFCHPDKADWIDSEGKLLWRSGEASLGFGKYRHRSLRELVASDAPYLRWITRSDFPQKVKQVVTDALNGTFPQRNGVAA